MNKTKLQHITDQFNHFPLSGSELEDVFYVFALRVTSDESIGKRKLSANRFYYMLDGFTISEDGIRVSKERYKKTIYDYYLSGDHPHVSISAIVGENGAGKSSLVEFELRLINNFASVIFGEHAKDYGLPHLHFIDKVHGELYYILNQDVYCLSVKGRDVQLYCYSQQENNDREVLYTDKKSLINGDSTPIEDVVIANVYYTSHFENIKKLLSHFYYTIVLNQSVYAYNTRDFEEECNSNAYETRVRKGPNAPEEEFSSEDKCWLNGLFHKNDGYQIPVVLSPCRHEGNYDINVENRLAFERLISIMVWADESERIINGHLEVVSLKIDEKEDNYDLDYIHKKIGYHQFTQDDYLKMREKLIKKWSDHIGYDIMKKSQSYIYRTKAVNYLVYKTLKIADTYDEYRDFKWKYNKNSAQFDENDFESLVEKTIANNSHVTNKLFRTIAYLIWDIYEVHPGTSGVHMRLDDISERWKAAYMSKKLPLVDSVSVSLMSEAAIPPPFLDVKIRLVESNTGINVAFESLSSGEKQHAFTTSFIVYHLKNIDSVNDDRSTNERVAYKYVQLILEEVELYFHPELQKQFVINLLNSIKQAGLKNIKWINLCLVTHSPFVLSDISTDNVLALRKDEAETTNIPSFSANIHDMLKTSFFLESGSVGDFANWMINRIAKCLKVARWINCVETPPAFFPSMKNVPDEYKFLEDIKSVNNQSFNSEDFNYVYSPETILHQINMIEEPIIRRVLLDDYNRTYPERENDYKKSMKSLLKSQLDALGD